METKTKMNVRTRKAIERERKKAKKSAIKAEFKRAVKGLIIFTVIVLILFIAFIVTEVARFNSDFGVPPGIIRSEEYATDTQIYTGLLGSYTITYKYAKPFEEYKTADELTEDQIVSGEFKLFNKWLISAWIH